MQTTLDTDIDIINAALAATGNALITSLEDGTAEAAVAATNYERILGEALAYPWTWTLTTRRLNRIDGATQTAFTVAYQVPAGMEIERVEVRGRPIPWESMSDLILCNAEDDVVAVGRWRPPVRKWPPDFRNALALRLEALFLRALGEAHGEAAARDDRADAALRRAWNVDSRKRSPRAPGRSALIEARRHG